VGSPRTTTIEFEEGCRVKNSDHAADLQVRSSCLDLRSSLLIPVGSELPLGLGTRSIRNRTSTLGELVAPGDLSAPDSAQGLPVVVTVEARAAVHDPERLEPGELGPRPGSQAEGLPSTGAVDVLPQQLPVPPPECVRLREG